MIFQEADFERAAQEYEQAACDEDHVAVERKRGKEWVLSEVKQSKPVSQATDTKTREEVCSMGQRRKFKGIKGKVSSICKNISRVFGATCQKFNGKSKSNRLRVEKKLKLIDSSCLILLLKDRIIRICSRQTGLVRLKVHQKFSSCDKNVVS